MLDRLQHQRDDGSLPGLSVSLAPAKASNGRPRGTGDLPGQIFTGNGDPYFPSNISVGEQPFDLDAERYTSSSQALAPRRAVAFSPSSSPRSLPGERRWQEARRRSLTQCCESCFPRRRQRRFCDTGTGSEELAMKRSRSRARRLQRHQSWKPSQVIGRLCRRCLQRCFTSDQSRDVSRTRSTDGMSSPGSGSPPARDRQEAAKNCWCVDEHPGGSQTSLPDPEAIPAAAAFVAAASVLGPKAPGAPQYASKAVFSEGATAGAVDTKQNFVNPPVILSEEAEFRRQLRAKIAKTIGNCGVARTGHRQRVFTPDSAALALPSSDRTTRTPPGELDSGMCSSVEPASVIFGERNAKGASSSTVQETGHATASDVLDDASLSIVGAEVRIQGLRMELLLDGAATGRVAGFDAATGDCKVVLEASGALRTVNKCGDPRVPPCGCSIASQEEASATEHRSAKSEESAHCVVMDPSNGAGGAHRESPALQAMLARPASNPFVRGYDETSSSDDDSLVELKSPAHVLILAQ